MKRVFSFQRFGHFNEPLTHTASALHSVTTWRARRVFSCALHCRTSVNAARKRTFSTLHSKDMELIVAIDQGTSSNRVLIFNKNAEVVSSHQEEFQQIYPQPGWAEHDPFVILNSVKSCIDGAVSKCRAALAGKPFSFKVVGITNQRETTVVWDKVTGKPLHNALVWLDMRTASTVHEAIHKVGSKDHFRRICGLPITTYFSACKLKWLLDNVPAVKQACEDNRCLFGTIDSWLIWNLTGGVNGGVHVTDVTNASRTMLMNLKTAAWDPEVCSFFGVPQTILPAIKSSAEIYGHISDGALQSVPIGGCLGDQHAAMVGQSCFQSGSAKNTYGTGCFMLFNTGSTIVQSTHGLLTTVGYQLGPTQPITYALEGSIAIAGAAIQWLRDNLGIIKSSPEVNELASQVNDTAGVCFVPAFSGLFAPYWRDDARGTIVGLTQYSNKNHIARATLEAVCFQSLEVIDAMCKDSGVALQQLKVDGGMTKSDLTLQIQADLSNIEVVRPENVETTALGTAFAAGLAVGIWSSVKDLPTMKTTSWKPSISETERAERIVNWKKAIERSLGWKDN